MIEEIKMKKIFFFLILVNFVFSLTIPKKLDQNQLPKDLKQKFIKTMTDIKSIGNAISDYIIDYSFAPKVKSVQELSTILEPFYIKKIPIKDVWGNDYYYKVDEKEADRYFIGCAGSDGKFLGFNQKGYYSYNDLNGRDIILSNSQFKYCPKVENNLRPKIISTMDDLISIGDAIEKYISKNASAPRIKSNLELFILLNPFCINKIPTKDAWGNTFYYKVDKNDLKKYWIGSGGSDRSFEGFNQKGYYSFTDLERLEGEDIIFSNRKFSYGPKIRINLVQKIKITMDDMKSIATAIDDYMTDFYCAPKVESIEELNDDWFVPFYIKNLTSKDAWGNNYYYKVDKKNPDIYWIGSAGSDGKFKGFKQKGYYTVLEGKDIIISNGKFIYSPKRK